MKNDAEPNALLRQTPGDLLNNALTHLDEEQV